jgi:uncharacterized membrane protein YeaQ/YmgE (transglycosylase-associated protein family)
LPGATACAGLLRCEGGDHRNHQRVLIGAIIGGLGRLVIPGRQSIALWLTIAIGIVAALLGTLVASIFGVANTPGVDWIELALQIGLAAIGVSIFAGRSRRAG